MGEADEGLVVADEHVDADAVCVQTVQDVLDRLGAGGVLQAVNSNCHLGNSVQMSLNMSVRDQVVATLVDNKRFPNTLRILVRVSVKFFSSFSYP